MVELAEIINVASVPQRSPFRYPGGKTWLVPRVRLWLRNQPEPVEELVEPFAGGGIVGLTAAFEGLAKRVTLVEMDPDVAAVWITILRGGGDWLAQRIISFKLTPRSAREVLSSECSSLEERAFATVVRNRVQRGGILAPGAGLMKNGENGKGVVSRWYPQTLRKRILDIVTIGDRITFVRGDGLKHMENTSRRKGIVYFIDPPYTVAGRRLYRYSEINHRELFALATKVRGDFLMTYDNTQEIRQVAGESGLDTEAVTMKNTHHAKMTELLIGRNLDWLRSCVTSQPDFPEFAFQTHRGSPRLRP